MVVTADGYVSVIRSIIGRLAGSPAANMTVAAQPIADASSAGGVLQAFGTGHSEAVAMDFAGRTGGLVPTNQILLRDLAVFGGEAAGEVAPVYLSANVPGGDEHNHALESRYAGRIRRTA